MAAVQRMDGSGQDSSARMRVMAYLRGKVANPTADDYRRALEANARNPGLIPGLVNPSVEAEPRRASQPQARGGGGGSSDTQRGDQREPDTNSRPSQSINPRNLRTSQSDTAASGPQYAPAAAPAAPPSAAGPRATPPPAPSGGDPASSFPFPPGKGPDAGLPSWLSNIDPTTAAAAIATAIAGGYGAFSDRLGRGFGSIMSGYRPMVVPSGERGLPPPPPGLVEGATPTPPIPNPPGVRPVSPSNPNPEQYGPPNIQRPTAGREVFGPPELMGPPEAPRAPVEPTGPLPTVTNSTDPTLTNALDKATAPGGDPSTGQVEPRTPPETTNEYDPSRGTTTEAPGDVSKTGTQPPRPPPPARQFSWQRLLENQPLPGSAPDNQTAADAIVQIIKRARRVPIR